MKLNLLITGLETLTGTTVTSQEGPYYYDGINNRTAANVTVTTSVTSESVVQQIYQILDYGKVGQNNCIGFMGMISFLN